MTKLESETLATIIDDETKKCDMRFISNIYSYQQKHVLKCLKLAKITEYEFRPGYDLLDNLDPNLIGLWINETKVPEHDIDLFLHAFFEMSRQLKELAVKQGYAKEDAPITDFYYGMNLEDYKKKHTKRHEYTK